MRASKKLRLIAAWLRKTAEPADLAERLLDAKGVETVHSMREVAERLKIDVEDAPGLPDSVSGYAAPENLGGYVAVNSRKHRAHQEMTIGHEIGHHCLHDLGQDGDETAKQRSQADMFALGLLSRHDGVTRGELERHNPGTEADTLLPLAYRFLAKLVEVGAEVAAATEEAARDSRRD